MDKLKKQVKFRGIFLSAAIIFYAFSAYAADATRLLEYNLGNIPSDTIVKQKYQFHEEIKSALSLCECVKADVYKKEEPDKEPLWIINIAFNPQGYAGDVSQDILLLDKNDNLITLRIKAFVK